MDALTFGVYCLAILALVTIALIAEPQVAVSAFRALMQLRNGEQKPDKKDSIDNDSD